MEHVSNKDDMKTSLRKVVRETSHEMMMQCVSRVVSHPLHGSGKAPVSNESCSADDHTERSWRCCELRESRRVMFHFLSHPLQPKLDLFLYQPCVSFLPVISMRCMVQFVGREVKYSGVFSAIGRIFKEEGILGFFVGLVPHILGDVIFLWCCNLLAHFINTYAVDDNFSQASVIRSYTKFVMGIAVSMLTYPFLLVGDLMAVNNCGGSCSVAPACCSAGRPSQPPPSPSTDALAGRAHQLGLLKKPQACFDICIFLFSDPKSMVPELTPPLQQGQQQTSGHLSSGSSWTKAPSSWLSRLECVAERAERPCPFGPGCIPGVAGEVQEYRKWPGTKGASLELQGQKTALFCLSWEAAGDPRSPPWESYAR
ncbi:mitochondrial carrier homolog 1 isoform X3 [Parus major]|uniref:mitochondrial carrier homolog 1 isoform X3 n=1 Tax=Parus major TaxID=9157 RepID=UPI0014446AAD|nr:mitochondrial carrier homolog 1 isoform X3 [Parus major]